MIRHMLSISLALVCALSVIWIAASLIREPDAPVDRPGRDVLMTFKSLNLPSVAPLPPQEWWDETIIYCCPGCRFPDPRTELLPSGRILPELDAVMATSSQKPTHAPHHHIAAAELRQGQWVVPSFDIRYPRMAEAAGKEGNVLVEAWISPKGDVISTQVLHSDPQGVFDKAALNAVEESSFAPHGTALPATTPTRRHFLIRFSLASHE